MRMSLIFKFKSNSNSGLRFTKPFLQLTILHYLSLIIPLNVVNPMPRLLDWGWFLKNWGCLIASQNLTRVYRILRRTPFYLRVSLFPSDSVTCFFCSVCSIYPHLWSQWTTELYPGGPQGHDFHVK